MDSPSSSHNGHSKEHKKSKHKDKEEKYRKKYVCGPDGKPIIGPDGHRIRLKQPKHEKQDHDTGEFQGAKKQKKIKYENDDKPDSEALEKAKNKVKKEAKKRHADDKATAKKHKKVKKEEGHDDSINGFPTPTEQDDFDDEKKQNGVPAKRVKKEVVVEEKWKWWEEKEERPEGVKWTFLEHKGPLFAPPYEPLPSDIYMTYNGKRVDLEEDAEEVMTFYAKMLNHDYVTKEDFNRNFFKDWRTTMTHEEKKLITDLGKCDFKKVHNYFTMRSEQRKARSKEEKKAEKEKNEEIQKEYGYCSWDGHKEKIGNFRIEPPGLFRGRGEHPKMGKLKRRVLPEDVIINCSKDSNIPEPPEGHKWKMVKHDNTVTWLVTWTENIQGQTKYIMLNPNSRIKGEKDWQKYEIARRLKDKVDKIRNDYLKDLKSSEMVLRQRAVALYFIDKLALRAGNEKDSDEAADTVGCCSLRCEHIELLKHDDGKDYVVEFDFLGKDSVRYYNKVPVLKQVFKNLTLFKENKEGSDDLFDRLNTSTLNQYLRSLMEGLTAKVFRTYNASITLQNQLKELTDPDDENVASKVLCYNRANRAVAVLCNHQRAAPKNFDDQMGRMNEKIKKKNDDIAEAKDEIKRAKSDYKASKTEGKRKAYEAKKKKLERLQEQLIKLEVAATDKEENKQIALGTSKLNYLDPRITVAWCKKFDVPIEKCYNKTQRDKFAWAIAMVDEDYEF